jgi:hypothetical protein
VAPETFKQKFMKQPQKLKLYVVMIAVGIFLTIFLNFFRTSLGHGLSGQGGWSETETQALYNVLHVFGIVLIGEIIGRVLYLQYGKKHKAHAKVNFSRNIFLGLILASILGVIGGIVLNLFFLVIASYIVFLAAFGLFAGYKISESFDKI